MKRHVNYPVIGLALTLLVVLLAPAAGHARLLLLEADFDSRTPGDSLARRGALFGEPVSGPNDRENEFIFEDAPGDNSVEIPDTQILGTDELYWSFREDREISDGRLFIRCELELESLDEYRLRVRSADLETGNFFLLILDSAGNVSWRDGDDPGATLAGTYTPGTVHEVVLEYNLESGLYNFLWDGTTVVAGESHGVVGQGIGALVIGHPDDGNATGSMRFDMPSVSWRPGTTRQILDANFNDQPLGQPIDFGGAALGQPVSASGAVPVVEVGLPLGNPALVIADDNAVGIAATTFEFLDSVEPAAPLSVSFWVAFDQLEDYIIRVREQGGAAESFLDIVTNSSGQVFISDASDGGAVHTLHTYAAQTPIRIEMTFEPDFGYYGIWWDGERIVYREAHEIVGREPGSLIFGCGFDADLDGVMYLDALRVHTLEEPFPTAVTPSAPTLGSLRASPNPFNPATEIAFELTRDARVTLDVFDSRGRRVGRLIDGNLPAGRHAPVWTGLDATGRRVASGVYHAMLSVDGRPTHRVSLTLVK